MTSDNYIRENKTKTFRKGDKVVMHSCGEAGHHRGKIWECQTDSYKNRSGSNVVFLKGFSGSFSCNYLQIVNVQ